MHEEGTPRRQRIVEDPLRTFKRALTRLYVTFVLPTYPFASRGRGALVHPSFRLERPDAHHIKLGEHVDILKDVWFDVQPASDPSTERVVKLVIGDRCRIGLRNTISVKNEIILENDIMTADSVLIVDHTKIANDPEMPIRYQGSTVGGTIKIEKNCWIGHCSAIICSGGDLVIGRNSIIGANAVVTHSVPPYSVVLGNPARVVKRFDATRGLWVPGSAKFSGTDLVTH